MRIDQIKIKNYKCFEDETFELNPHFTVLIGNNGKGKTAFLDALAIMISNIVLGNKHLSSSLISDLSLFYKYDLPSFDDIRVITIDDQPKPQNTKIKVFGKIGQKDCNWSLSASPMRLAYGNGVSGSSNKQDAIDLFCTKIEQSRKKTGVIFPLVAYYSTSRLWNKDKQEIKYQEQTEGIMLAYLDSFIANTSSNSFLSWYKTLEDEIRKFDKTKDKILLKVINDTISSMIPKWENMAFSFKENDLVGILDGEYRLFRQLSDGYRNTIGMVADMIYRCIQLNPHLGENVLKETNGVVLIDELDLHLHPQWQLRIVGDLKRIFPKVQFVATTHSPFIIQSLKSNELIDLDKDNKLETDPFRASIEEIVEKTMGVEQKRSQEFEAMQQAAKEFYILIKNKADKENIAKAKQKLDKLRLRFNHDPAFVAQLESELPQ